MSSEGENNSWKLLYLKGTIIAVVAFLVSILFLISSWYGWFNLFGDEPKVWFQRSGSIMVVILLLAEYQVYKMVTDLRQGNMIPHSARRTQDKYRPYIPYLQYVAILATLLATIIWGYGDIVFSALQT